MQTHTTKRKQENPQESIASPGIHKTGLIGYAREATPNLSHSQLSNVNHNRFYTQSLTFVVSK